MREVLRDGAVDDAGRTKLRDYRVDKGVDSLHHLRVLDKMGWTLDDLEEGKRLARPAGASASAPGGVRGNAERSPLADLLGKEAVDEEACAVVDEGGEKGGPRLTPAGLVKPH